MAHPLAGYGWKRLRARQHFDTLHGEIDDFLTTRPFRLSTQFAPHARKYLIKAHVLKEPPLSLSVLIGDCLYNLRSALDHLAWQLAIYNGNQPSSHTEFPIFLEQKRFW
jgi:hypothetical protein